MKRHILFVSTLLPSAGCGPPVINYRHLKRLKNWKVSVLADRRTVQKAHNLPKSWQVIPIPYSYRFGPYIRYKLFGLLHRQLKEKPSAILNHFGTNSILAYYLSKEWNVPLSIIMHDRWEIWTKSWIERYYMGKGWDNIILAHASKIWSNAPEVANPNTINEPQKISIMLPIPEGNTNSFPEWKNNFKTNPVVAFAGSFRLHEMRHFKVVAGALQKINGRLILTTTKNHVAKILLKNFSNIEFREPSVDNIDAIRFFSKKVSCILTPLCFNLNRHPWRKAGFPAKLLEFAHVGLPMIVLAPRGTPLSKWAIEHKWHGYLDTLDSKRVLELLMQITNKENWIRMAKQSRNAALNEFNPDAIQAQFESELVV